MLIFICIWRSLTDRRSYEGKKIVERRLENMPPNAMAQALAPHRMLMLNGGAYTPWQRLGKSVHVKNI